MKIVPGKKGTSTTTYVPRFLKVGNSIFNEKFLLRKKHLPFNRDREASIFLSVNTCSQNLVIFSKNLTQTSS